jgi:DNA-directed RNA polymerase specialized sigma24 family protein
MTRTVPQSSPNLTRAREAFVYSIRRRSLRFAQLLGVGQGQAQECLQHALATFLAETRSLALSAWSNRWWALLLQHTARYPKSAPFAIAAETEAWKLCWNRLPERQRGALLLCVWLGLDAAEVGAALDLDRDAVGREMALASMQLRRALRADGEDTRWLDLLRDAFDHAQLAAATAALNPSPTPSTRPGRRRATAAVLAAVTGGLLLLAGLALLIPREEPLPEDLALPEGATGLRRGSAAPSTLPPDLAMLLDQDWTLWAEPESAPLIRELEFYAWLEAEDEHAN